MVEPSVTVSCGLAQSSDVQLTGAESQLGQSSSRADEGLLTAPDPAIGALTTMVISRER